LYVYYKENGNNNFEADFVFLRRILMVEVSKAVKPVKIIENILKEKKWIRNDLGMGRTQCVKLTKINDEPIIVISSAISIKPLWARISRFLAVECNIIAFYEGAVCEELEREDYEHFKEFFTPEEWSVIYGENTEEELENMSLITRDDTLYAEVFELYDEYEADFNEVASEEINNYFKL
jgi:hypothetical protein